MYVRLPTTTYSSAAAAHASSVPARANVIILWNRNVAPPLRPYDTR